MNILVYLVVFIFFIILFVVGVYNGGDVIVDLVFWQLGPVPMGAVIATAALFGTAFACIIGVIDGIKIRITNRQLRRQMGRLEEEVDTPRLRLARHEGAAGSAIPPTEAPSRPEPTAS
ncbi:MAG TPA: LapA family protein [Candidatus Polarisedimenticolia bacterium]|nr:LapA family protein [Candidatus Polarisedimenticolia bacterium]